MKLQPPKRASVSEYVLQQLLDGIRDGRLSPGERLPTEAELASQLKVGRSTVREALRVLIVMGLIETRPGRGAHVLRQAEGILPERGSSLGMAKHLERVAQQDLFEVRETIEGRAAELAAERATEADLEEVERCASIVVQKVLGGKTYYEANQAFHLAIAKASHNYVLVESVAQLHGHHQSSSEQLMLKAQPMRDRDIAEHQAIVEAIRARDGARARQAMEHHIRSSLEVIRHFEVGDTVRLMLRPAAKPGRVEPPRDERRTRKRSPVGAGSVPEEPK